MHHVGPMNATLTLDDSPPIDRAVAREAARWLVRLQAGEVTDEDMAACERWRAADPQHERAWRRAMRIHEKFEAVPQEIGMSALGRRVRVDRRAALKTLAILIATVPFGYMTYRATPWREWAENYRTAAGERRDFLLADGTRVHLNTASAVEVAFDDDHRRLILRTGEILVETGADSDYRFGVYRPFIVQTAQGRIRALGTRFVVRQREDGTPVTQVSVLEGAVEIRPEANPERVFVVEAGQQTSFTVTGVNSPRPADPHAADWSRGVLFVSRMRLGDFAAELGRYRPGLLRCDPAVAGLHITGAFQLDNTDSILAALPDTLPVQVVYRTRYWVSIVPPQADRDA